MTTEPLDIGHRLELFTDDYLIARLDGVAHMLHPPQPCGPVIAFDAPWEGATSAYVTILEDGGRYRMYYRGSGAEGAPEVTCYAESDDAIAWHKPALGLHEFAGSHANNIIWTGYGSHNLTPFLDTGPASTPDTRYKAVGGTGHVGTGLIALASPDGIHWRRWQEEPLAVAGAFDSQNVPFWDAVRGCYALYLRIFIDGVRAIARSTSPNFRHWSATEPVILTGPDGAPAAPEHFYTNAAIPYPRAPHILLAFPKRFMPKHKLIASHVSSGVSDGVFLSSRDGVHFDYRFREAFLRPGREWQNWTERNNMVARGLVATAPDQLSLYYSRHYHHATNHLERGVVRTDGFVSLHAGWPAGEVVTKPLRVSGARLLLNYATSAAGSVQVEVQSPDGTPLPGYTLAEGAELYGDEIADAARWAAGDDLSPLRERVVRLRFRLADADLYAMRWADGEE